MKTKIEIIKETKEYYSEDPSRRAINNGCMYFDGGNMCAVDRCLMNAEDIQNKIHEAERKYKMEGNPLLHTDFSSLYNSYILIEDFKEEYKIEDEEFWDNLQTFHDRDRYWTFKSISDEGIEYYNQLLDKYKNQ